ncbi:MAG: hypothetical protein V3V12_04955 [Gammaproteobacteria bacterium]
MTGSLALFTFLDVYNVSGRAALWSGLHQQQIMGEYNEEVLVDVE